MIQLKIPPWAASVWGAETLQWIIVTKERWQVSTVGDLLTELVLTHHGFDKVVFDLRTGKAGDYTLVFLNDNLLQEPDMAGIKLKDSDIVLLLPEISGG